MYREPLPEAFGRRDGGGGGRERRGLRTGRSTDDSPPARWEMRRSYDHYSPHRLEQRSPSRGWERPARRRSRSRSPPRRRSRSPPPRDWERREFGRDRRAEQDDRRGDRDVGRYEVRAPSPNREWHHHLNPASAEEGEVARLAGCLFRSTRPLLPWWGAVEMGQTERVKQLLSVREIEINDVGGPYGSTPLGWAAFTGDAALATLLLERSADPNIPAKKGSYPLHMACWNGDHVEVVELLLRAGAKTEVHNRNGQTPLEQAIWFDRLERDSLVEQVYRMAEWTKARNRPPAGRRAIIRALGGEVEPVKAAAADTGGNSNDEVEEGPGSAQLASQANEAPDAGAVDAADEMEAAGDGEEEEEAAQLEQSIGDD
ncbi:MAG: hypothetical protein SGPRY_007824, partial [Prymnesium sp.]